MGEWSNTAFVHLGEDGADTGRSALDLVVDGLTSVFRADGYAPIPHPGARVRTLRDVMQYGDALSSSMWGVVVMTGRGGWCVVKTAPFELLCERGPDDARPRLAALAEHLGAEAFQLNLYDSVGLVAVEATADGAHATSGFDPSADDPFLLYGERVPESRWEAGLHLLDHAEIEDALDDAGANAVSLAARALGSRNQDLSDNAINGALVAGRRPDVAGTEMRVVYFAREASAPSPEPLELTAELELRTSYGTLELDVDGAVLELVWKHRISGRPDVMPAWGGRVRCPDPENGARVVERIVDWLGVPLPAPPVQPSDADSADGTTSYSPVVTGVRYSLSEIDTADAPDALTFDAERAWELLFGTTPATQLRLFVDEKFERAALAEVDSHHRSALVDGLAQGLRHGPPRAALPAGWSVSPMPLASTPRRLLAGPCLRYDWCNDTLVTSHQRADVTLVRRWRGLGESFDDIAELGGLVSSLAGDPVHERVVAVSVEPRRHGIGGDDPASLVLIDTSTGELRTMDCLNVAAFSSLSWSPDGRELAVELSGSDHHPGRIAHLEFHDGGIDGDVSTDFIMPDESIRSANPRAWTSAGLVVRTQEAIASESRRRTRTRWHRWHPDRGLEPIEPDHVRSPDGDVTIRTEADGSLVVFRDAREVGRLPGDCEAPFLPTPGHAPTWLRGHALVLEWKEPLVLEVGDSPASGLTLRYLLPPARPHGHAIRAGVGSGRVAFEPLQGELWVAGW